MLALAVTIFGIIILVKRKASLSKNKVCVGWPAVFVGLLFISILPLGLCLGILLGIYATMNGIPEQDIMKYAIGLDLGVLVLILISGVSIMMIFGRPQHEIDQAQARDYDKTPQGDGTYAPRKVPKFDEQNPYRGPMND